MAKLYEPLLWISALTPFLIFLDYPRRKDIGRNILGIASIYFGFFLFVKHGTLNRAFYVLVLFMTWILIQLTKKSIQKSTAAQIKKT